jgi:hypothetical protein
MTVEQSQLVDEHRPKSDARGVNPALRGNLLVYIEDALEVLVEVLVGQAAHLVEDASDFDALIGVRVSSSFGGYQEPHCAFICLPVVGRIVVVLSLASLILPRVGCGRRSARITDVDQLIQSPEPERGPERQRQRRNQ